MNTFQMLPGEAYIAPEASKRIRRRVMRQARRLRWQHRAAQLWQLATANAWDVVFVVVIVIWLFWR